MIKTKVRAMRRNQRIAGHPPRDAGVRRLVRSEGGFGLVEVLVAAVLGSIGFLAIASMQLGTLTQGRIADARTTQALVAQQVLEEVLRQGYAAASTGNQTTTVDGQPYTVRITVTNTAIRVKRVAVTVPGPGTMTAQTYITRIHERRPVPSVP